MFIHLLRLSRIAIGQWPILHLQGGDSFDQLIRAFEDEDTLMAEHLVCLCPDTAPIHSSTVWERVRKVADDLESAGFLRRASLLHKLRIARARQIYGSSSAQFSKAMADLSRTRASELERSFLGSLGV